MKDEFICEHVLAKKSWPSIHMCFFDKVFCTQVITFQRLSITLFSQFLKCGDEGTFFCQFKGSFKKTYLSFIHTYPHLSHPKARKVKLPRQIKSSDNQPNPIILEKKKAFQQNTNSSHNN